ncbi:hypothetical protein SB01139_05036 [Klebsiella pneumoniae]|nr:hypothetical protein SB01139_05036 [Klebsiella pneumoniae]
MQPRVGGKAKPDPHLTQQPGDKAQIILAVLHHLLAARIRFCQREQKILTAQAVALAEDFFHNLRNGLVLVNGVLVRAVKQRQARLKRQRVVRFIPGGTEPFKPRHHALDNPHGLLNIDAEALSHRRLQRQGGCLHQHHLFADGMVCAGEFNTVAERLAQGFIALEGQHIKPGFTSLHRKQVVVVAESDRGVTAHSIPSHRQRNYVLEKQTCIKLVTT